MPSYKPCERPLRIAVNGYGRIGRCIVRAFYESNDVLPRRWCAESSVASKVVQMPDVPALQIVAINASGKPENLAHLTRYDTVHGRFQRPVSVRDGVLSIGEDTIHLLQERDPEKLPWTAYDIDLVLECTGAFTSKAEAMSHVNAGAGRVLLSGPGSGPVDATVVYGVNHSVLSPLHKVVSNASCTTNCLAPLLACLHEAIGVESGSMLTVHAYTNDQVLTDSYHSDPRRARAAAASLIPTKTGAAAAIGLVLPQLAGKLDGFAMRAPVMNVSVVHLTFLASRPTTVEEVNGVMQEAATGSLCGVLAYNEAPLVSSDFNHTEVSSYFDATLTKVIQSRMVSVSSWYDNEWGFAHRMLDVAAAWSKVMA